MDELEERGVDVEESNADIVNAGVESTVDIVKAGVESTVEIVDMEVESTVEVVDVEESNADKNLEEVNDNADDNTMQIIVEINDNKEENTVEKRTAKETEHEDGMTCPICFGEYTSSGDHRTASLKCGHLFGLSCILEWFGKRKSALCPVCTVKCTKNQIRIIFASRVLSLNTEKEHKLVEQYIGEFNAKNKLLEEVKRLKAEIDILKLKNKTECTCPEKNNQITILSYFTRTKVKNINKYSNIIYDDINNLIVLSTLIDDMPCLIKYYSTGIFSQKIFDTKGIITHMKCFDGNILISINKKIFIMNLYNFNIIFEDTNDFKVTSLFVSEKNRNKLIIGDDHGNIVLYTLGINKRAYKVCDVPIHSILEGENNIFIGTVYKIYELKIESDWDNFISSNDPLNAQEMNLQMHNMACINIFGSKNQLYFVYRNRSHKTFYYYMDEQNKKTLNFGFSQFRRFNEFVCNNLCYLIDQETSKIIVINNNHEKVCEYKLDEDVYGFYIKSDVLIALTQNFIHVYKKQ